MKLTWLALALSTCAALAATEEQTNQTFTVAPGGTVVVDVDFGSIEIGTNSADAVTVHVWRKVTRGSAEKEKKFLSENPVVFEQDGNTITVRSHARAKSSFHWFEGGGNRSEARYTLQVPARFNARLTTSGGDILATNLTGEVKADTSGGDLRFVQLHGALSAETSGGDIHLARDEGPIKVHTSGGDLAVAGGSGSLAGTTSGGDVTVKTFTGPVSVHTSGGEIDIENIAGQVEGGTSGGSIKAVLLAPVPGGVTLSTSGGDVNVSVPAAAAFNLDAKTSGGGVRCDLPVTVQGKLEGDRIEGVVNGGGPVIKLRTSGGAIHVRKS